MMPNQNGERQGMSVQCEVTAKQAAGAEMGLFERWLTLWVFLCILAGIGLGHWLPAPFQAVGGLELARVNLPVAALIWLTVPVDEAATTGRPAVPPG